tara:strand:+ start:161 stop:316 length:156 start_codon:yes stop_codon:yes gene_type:complete
MTNQSLSAPVSTLAVETGVFVFRQLNWNILSNTILLICNNKGCFFKEEKNA